MATSSLNGTLIALGACRNDPKVKVKRLRNPGAVRRQKLQVRAQASLDVSLLEGHSNSNGKATGLEKEKKVFKFRSRFASRKDKDEGLLRSIFERAKMSVLNAIVRALYKPQDEPNLYYQGNFGPVKEVGSWVPVQVIDGEIPKDFPAGTYIRNGPNPYFGGHDMNSPLGKAWYHWFEGDGMLHATRFDKGGQSVSYQNKFVETTSYKLEKATNKVAFLTAVEGDALAISMSYFLNQLRFGKVNKPTCNTQIFQHAGRVYAVSEGDIAYEIDLSDLSTLGTLDFGGEWDRPFTSHPKVDIDTKELVIFSFSAQEPYVEMGIVSHDGELTHKADLGVGRCIFMHELPITKHYNLILDFPLTVNVERLMRGGSLIEFEKDSYSKIGVMPRRGDAKSVKWFDVEVGHAFHSVNAFEDGDEVVFHAILVRYPLVPSPRGMDKIEWFARAITPTDPNEAKEPWIDGALLGRLHEWRFNLEKGTVVERDLTDLKTSGLEMPTINRGYTGRKNLYAYAQVLDLDASRAVGMPKYGKMVKLHLPNSTQDGIKMEYHDLGENRFGSEPLFVARPNARGEDDGWIVTYVHDESTDISEVYIVDALNFEEKAIARIQLPQRVPYGFHSDYFLET